MDYYFLKELHRDFFQYWSLEIGDLIAMALIDLEVKRKSQPVNLSVAMIVTFLNKKLSKLPKISVLAAVIFLLMGQQNFIDLLSSWLPVMKPYGWVTELVSIMLGGFLIYAFTSNGKARSVI